MASITVRPVSGLKMRASRLLIPQSREPDPFRKKPTAGAGTSVWKFLASPSASGTLYSPPTSRPARLALDKPQRVDGQLLLVLEQRPPDLRGGGEIRQEVAEGLNREPTVVADVTQRLECRIPGH